MMAEQAFLGVGWKFPVQVDANKVAISRYDELVQESIRIILGTSRGERVMRPDFGADLKRLAVSPNNTSTAGLAIFYVHEAPRKRQPPSDMHNVDAHAAGESRQVLRITLRYGLDSPQPRTQ